MRKFLIASTAALVLSLAPASAVLAQEDPTIPDNPATDDTSQDDDNFDDWGLLGLLGLVGLAGLGGRKKADRVEVTTNRGTYDDRTGPGASSR